MSRNNNQCQQLNPLCKKSDLANGDCLDCYQGYMLSGKTCIVAAAVNIPYCNRVVGNSCAECISGYYTSNGGCALANVLCATYNPNTGACHSCVPGYVFQEGGCILPSLGIDPYCVYYTNSYCSKCMNNFALINYMCSEIDPNCAQFDQATNTCLKCKKNMIAMGPSCI